MEAATSKHIDVLGQITGAGVAFSVDWVDYWSTFDSVISSGVVDG